jgi:hypothetical protein
VVEHLLSTHEALSSNPSINKKLKSKVKNKIKMLYNSRLVMDELIHQNTRFVLKFLP